MRGRSDKGSRLLDDTLRRYQLLSDGTARHMSVYQVQMGRPVATSRQGRRSYTETVTCLHLSGDKNAQGSACNGATASRSCQA